MNPLAGVTHAVYFLALLVAGGRCDVVDGKRRLTSLLGFFLNGQDKMSLKGGYAIQGEDGQDSARTRMS